MLSQAFAQNAAPDTWEKSLKLLLPPGGCGPPCFLHITPANNPEANSSVTVQINQPGEPFYPQNNVGRGWGIRNGAMGAVRLPKILVLASGLLHARRPVGNKHGTARH